MVNYGIVYGLSDYGLADRLEHPARGGAGVHRRATSSASRRSRRSSTARSSRRPRRATSRRCSAAAARSPSSARATGRCARSASASRSTPSSRAPRPTSSSSRWSAATRALRDAGLKTRLILRSTTSCSSRGPPEETRRGGRARPARDGRRRGSIDPPLAVDVGRRRQLAGGEVDGPRSRRRRSTALVGGAVALQAPINSHLGKAVGTFQAAFLSFAIGTVALLVDRRRSRAAASAASRDVGERPLVLPDRRPARRRLRQRPCSSPCARSAPAA